MPKKIDETDIKDLTTDDVILRIYKHILESRVLNGGFDKISVQIDNMEERLGSINEKVDKIDVKINDPESGLVVKYKELNLWQIQRDKDEMTIKEKFDKRKWLVIGFITSTIGSIALVLLEHFLKI